MEGQEGGGCVVHEGYERNNSKSEEKANFIYYELG